MVCIGVGKSAMEPLPSWIPQRMFEQGKAPPHLAKGSRSQFPGRPIISPQNLYIHGGNLPVIMSAHERWQRACVPRIACLQGIHRHATIPAHLAQQGRIISLQISTDCHAQGPRAPQHSTAQHRLTTGSSAQELLPLLGLTRGPCINCGTFDQVACAEQLSCMCYSGSCCSITHSSTEELLSFVISWIPSLDQLVQRQIFVHHLGNL